MSVVTVSVGVHLIVYRNGSLCSFNETDSIGNNLLMIVITVRYRSNDLRVLLLLLCIRTGISVSRITHTLYNIPIYSHRQRRENKPSVCVCVCMCLCDILL